MTTPDRSNDYQASSAPPTFLTIDIWNSVFGDIAARLRDREMLEASFELLQTQGIQASLDYIQATVAPQLELLQSEIALAQDQIDAIINEGIAPDSAKLGGELPAHYATKADATKWALLDAGTIFTGATATNIDNAAAGEVGLYHVPQCTGTFPTGASSYLWVTTQAQADVAPNAVIQEAVVYREGSSTHTVERYIRLRSQAGAWSAWVRMWHSGNFDPAAKADKAGGTFTGTITMGLPGASTGGIRMSQRASGFSEALEWIDLAGAIRGLFGYSGTYAYLRVGGDGVNDAYRFAPGDLQMRIGGAFFSVLTQATALATANYADNSVTLAKMADIATATLLGRATAGAGDPQALTGAQARAIIDAYSKAESNTSFVNQVRLGAPLSISKVENANGYNYFTASAGYMISETIQSRGSQLIDFASQKPVQSYYISNGVWYNVAQG